MSNKIYTVTKVESKPRSFLTAINHGLRGDVNEITIYMEKKTEWFWPFNWVQQFKAEGIVPENYDIHKALKAGDQFDVSEYPTLKITKL